MAQVIIVSNRLPVSVKKVDGRLEFERSVGGVATGLSSYTKNRRNRWVGWPGIASEELTEAEKATVMNELAKYNSVPVFLNQRQIDEFYNGYSNDILWPLLHNLPIRGREQREKYWKTYRQVNKLFAEVVGSLLQLPSTIWIQDYHLMLLPEYLRQERSNDQIGFFLHTPFPPPKVFLKLPESKRLIRGLLGADLIGFHTPGYVDNFLQTCQELGLGTPDAKQLILPDKVVRVTEFPMGIDYKKYAQANKSRAVKRAIKRYKRKYGRRKVIVAVDRLDPTKGLLERLSAYYQFLEANPKLHGKVVMVMVAAPASRMEIQAYKNLKKRLEQLAEEVNKEYGTLRWQPVDLIIQTLPFEEVSALYQLADVAFIAPLRDGMNLVAKEYIASKSNKRGVLILSETAGASVELTEALMVNPRRPATSVEALQQALTMPRRELRRRLRAMQSGVAENTVQKWARGFVHNLNQPIPGTPTITRNIRRLLRKELVKDYKQAKKRLLLLDYDGSLTAFSWNFRRAEPSRNLLDLLKKLAADPANEVVLISGRSRENLEDWFKGLPIALVAEHGAYIKMAGQSKWEAISKSEAKWKKVIRPVLETYAQKTPDAEVEEKDHSLVWHYRQSPPYLAQKHAVILKRILKPVLKLYGLELFNGNKIIEVKDPGLNKGAAIARWLKKQHDFILAIGDDFTDEDMFAILPETAYTIKVGRGLTRARFRLPSARDVRDLLQRFVK